jgi:hypothetical protein
VSLDEELAQAIYSRDEALVTKVMLRVPGEALSDLLKKTESDLVWLNRMKDMIVKAAALCVCGQIATNRDDTACRAHAGAQHRYKKASETWEKNPSDANARELMRATVEAGVETPEGVCCFPPCGLKTDYDYDRPCAWCDMHNALFNLAEKRKDNVKLLANLRKKRGEEVKWIHDEAAGEWKRHMSGED